MQDAKKQWQFDILGFAEATQGYTLSLLGFYMLKSQGLISEFGLDEAKLCVYLRRIESGYDDTIPYHNRYRNHKSTNNTHGCVALPYRTLCLWKWHRSGIGWLLLPALRHLPQLNCIIRHDISIQLIFELCLHLHCTSSRSQAVKGGAPGPGGFAHQRGSTSSCARAGATGLLQSCDCGPTIAQRYAS